MKRSVLSITVLVIMLATALMFVCSSTVSAKNQKDFFYDKKDTTETIYSFDNMSQTLVREFKYDFKYNEQGQVIEKKAYRWNDVRELWEPYYLITAVSNGNETTVKLARWNAEEETFGQSSQKVVYSLDATSELTSYTSYNWDKKDGRWEQLEKILLQDYLASAVVNNK